MGYSTEEPNLIGTHDLLYNEAIMVREGIGRAIAINGMIEALKESKLCFRPFDPKITVRLAVAWKKYQVLSKPAALFLEKLYDVAREE